MSSSRNTKGLRTWIDIDTKKLDSNIQAFREIIKPDVKLMGVVKSNAYGHGLVGISKAIIDSGVDWLGVDSIVEALKLREEGVTKPILVLGYTLPEMIERAVEHDISIAVSHSSTLDVLETSELSQKVKVHIKVDTGMYRQGFGESQINSVITSLQQLEKAGKIKVEGLFTHFASAKNPSFPEYTKNQIKSFEVWREAFVQAGFSVIAHASATAGTLLFPEAHYDMVRIGIGLYGLWPSKESEAFASGRVKLEPVMTWKTLIAETKHVPAGSKIGYDGSETLTRDSIIAICPVGYWHGFPRAFSSVGQVLVNGKRAKIVGRVSMDMIIIDITNCGEVGIGDEVVLLGKQGNAEISAEQMAYLADGSWYEIITRINPLIRKNHL